MEITMLGTSCMVPTKERNVQGIFVDFKGDGLLFDCGEGTQRQMNIAGINRNRIRKIFITHWHGDHVAGLIGLLQTISNNENPQKVMLFGPRDTKERIAHLMRSVSFEDNRMELEVKEINPNGVEKVSEAEEYYVEAAYLDHKIPCLGYSLVEKDKRKINMAKAKKLGLREGPLIGKLQAGHSVNFKGATITPDDVSHIEKGKKIAIILDTLPCKNAYDLAKEADLLIAESAYTSDLEEKSLEYKHMTTKHAALIATTANVKKLIITHFSQRYKTAKELEEEIKTFFPNSQAAFDFMKIKL
ncbi:ribonuclease Z [Candidatus Woesearchaeota archaeon]|nr:ribonuclease Z [Candidatus Woesearchaeota archaeon]